MLEQSDKFLLKGKVKTSAFWARMELSKNKPKTQKKRKSTWRSLS